MIALSTFLLIAFGLASASVAIAGAVTRAEIRLAVVRQVEARLGTVADQPYEALVGNVMDVPDACLGTSADSEPTSASGVQGGNRSCFVLGGREYAIEYAVATNADGSLTVTATAAYDDPAGTGIDGEALVTRARTVTAPANTGTSALVRVLFAGSGSAEDLPVLVVDRDGTAVGPASRFANGVAVVRVDGDACSDPGPSGRGPCRIALSAGSSWAEAGGFVLSPADIVGAASQLVLRPGQVTEAVISPAPKGSAIVKVLAQPVNGGPPVPGAAAGSVCVWATFDTPAGDLSSPFCNTGSDRVIIDSFTTGGVRHAVPAGARFALTVDRPDGACPDPETEPGLAALVGSAPSSPTGWEAAAVCTSWTWGVPTSFASAGSNPVPFDPTSLRTAPVAQTSSNPAAYSLVWAATDATGAAVGRPAAGNGTVGVWEKPRSIAAAGACVVTATCASVALPAASLTPVPESRPGRPATCSTNVFCLSSTDVAPGLVSPGGTGGVYAPGGVATSFSLTVADAENSEVTARFTGLPQYGTLQLLGAAGAGALPATLTSSGVLNATLVYTPSASRPDRLDTVVMELSDSGGRTRTVTVWLYGRVQPLGVAVLDVTAAQGATADVTVSVTDTAGAPAAGARVTVAIDGGTRAPQLASVGEVLVTGADGVAYLRNVPVGAARAGSYAVTATLDNGAPVGAATLTVQAQAGALGRSPAGALTGAQGSSSPVQLRATDLAGQPMSGVPVQLYATAEDLNVTRSQLAAAGEDIGTVPCVTGLDGSCTTALLVGSAVRPGAKVLQLTTPGPPRVTSTGIVMNVTETLTTLQVSGQAKGARARIEVDQGSQAPLVVTALDGSGLDPMGGIDLSAALTRSGVSVLNPTQRTATSAGADLTVGQARFTIAATSGASLGSGALTITAPSATAPGGVVAVTVDVVVRPVLSSLTPSTAAVVAGGTTEAVLVARDGQTPAQPMEGAVVETIFPSGSPLKSIASAVSGPNGQITIPVAVPRGTAAGEYTFTVRSSSASSPSVEVTVSVTATGYVVNAPRSSLGLRQGAQAAWELEVLRPDGTPASGIGLTAACATAGCRLSFTAATSGADGRAVMTVTAAAGAGTGTVPVTVTASDGSRSTLALYVAPAAR